MQLRSLLRPFYLARRAGYWWYQRMHPDEPWLAQPAIRFLERELKPHMTGFEWGSGKSTVWFAQRSAQFFSIEHDDTWYQTTSSLLKTSNLDNVVLSRIPLEHDYRDLFSPYYDPLPAYVRTIEAHPDESFDFVLVDGYYRQPCARAALPKIKPGGLIIIDNTDWLPREQWPVPFTWPLEHQSRNALTQTSIWRKPTKGMMKH